MFASLLITCFLLGTIIATRGKMYFSRFSYILISVLIYVLKDHRRFHIVVTMQKKCVVQLVLKHVITNQKDVQKSVALVVFVTKTIFVRTIRLTVLASNSQNVQNDVFTLL